MKRTKIVRRTTSAAAAGFVGLLMLAAPVSAETYSGGDDNSTGQEADTQTPTTVTTPGSVVDPPVDGNATSGDGTSDDAALGQVDDDLAFTGSDARSLALVGAGVAGAGALLVVTSRRRNAEMA